MSKQPPPQEAQWPEGAIFTVGHSTLPIEEFIALLQTYGIECKHCANATENGNSLG